MRCSLVVGLLLGGLCLAQSGCQSEKPGLALRFSMTQRALDSTDKVTLTLSATSGSFGTLAMDRTDADTGVVVHAKDGAVVLTLAKPDFKLAQKFDLLLVPDGKNPVTMNLSATLAQADGQPIGQFDLANPIDLSAGKRTLAEVPLACREAATCAPIVEPGVLDLSNPPGAPLTMKIPGTAMGRRLVLLGAGPLTADQGDDLVVAEPAEGIAYVMAATDWTVPFFPVLPTMSYGLDRAKVKISFGGNGQIIDAGAIGDVNGDGKSDLVLASTNAMSAAGAVYIIDSALLRSSLGTTIDLSTTVVPQVIGSAAMESLGTTVALAHVSSQVALDLVLGAPGAAGEGGRARAGRVYVVPAPVGTVTLGEPGMMGVAQYATILGQTENEIIGNRMAAGDLDGDGVAEIALGSPLELDKKGQVFVIPGTSLSSGAAILLSGPIGGRITGAAGSLLGQSVWIDARARTLYAGAFGATSGLSPTVYRVTGAQAATQIDLGSGTPWDLKIVGTPASDFGASVTTGDFDGDGMSDVLVGAPKHLGPANRPRAGAAYLLSGADLAITRTDKTLDLNNAGEKPALVVFGARDDSLGDHVAFANFDLSDAKPELILGAQVNSNTSGSVYGVQDVPAL